MKRVMFEDQSTTEDWRYDYQLLAPPQAAWGPDDTVVVGLSPMAITWDDYGIRSRTFPPASADTPAPWFQASSRDGSGIVVLQDPNIISIVVPWNQMRMMGPGSVNVGLSLRNELTGSRTTLLIGNLPLYDGVI